MQNIFEKFDENIGTERYYTELKNKLTIFSGECRTYPKGSTFSRIRYINEDEAEKFSKENLKKQDFYPPNPDEYRIPQGRFNAENVRVLYLADHPFVALKECNIKGKQHFLFSNIILSTEMHFLYIKESTHQATNMLYQLFNTKDTRFYSVINKISKDLLSLPICQGMAGIAYESVKVEIDYQDRLWGSISSSTNLFISDTFISETDLVAGWMCDCDSSFKIFKHILFKPSDTQGSDELIRISYHEDQSSFISETTKIMKKNIDEDKKRKGLLNG